MAGEAARAAGVEEEPLARRGIAFAFERLSPGCVIARFGAGDFRDLAHPFRGVRPWRRFQCKDELLGQLAFVFAFLLPLVPPVQKEALRLGTGRRLAE